MCDDVQLSIVVCCVIPCYSLECVDVGYRVL